MINTNMEFYDFYLLGVYNAYGQLKESRYPQGAVKMSINVVSQSITDNAKYKDSQYIGLTHSKVDDTYIIDYKGKKLKVLYIIESKNYNQIFMSEM